MIGALAKDSPDGTPSEQLQDTLDRLLEASVQVLGEPASSSYAVDWTDQETWSLPPPKKPLPSTPAADPGTQPDDRDPAHNDNERQPPKPDCADPEASWGHRRADAPGHDDELFFGYYLQAATIVNDEHGPQVPELARRMHLSLLRSRPATRVRARPRTHAHRRHHDHRPARRLRLQLPRATDMGAPDPRARDRADLRSAPQRPRPARHPPRRDLPQRQPLLPRHPHHPAPARTTAPRRHPRTNRHPRPPVLRTGPLQALPDHPPRPRRLPPHDLPRRPSKSSAARTGRNRSRSRTTARPYSPRPSTRPSAAPKRRSPCRRP